MSIYRIETCESCGDEHVSSNGRWQYLADGEIGWLCDRCTSPLTIANPETVRDRLMLAFSPDRVVEPPNRKE